MVKKKTVKNRDAQTLGTALAGDGDRAEVGRLVRKALSELEGDWVTVRSPVSLSPALLENIRHMLSEMAGRQVQIDPYVVPGSRCGVMLLLEDGRRIELDLRTIWLEALERSLDQVLAEQAGQTLPEIAEAVAEAIESTEAEIEVEEMRESGVVTQVGDGIATVVGLWDIGSQEVIRLSGGKRGLAFSLGRDYVDCLLLDPEADVQMGSEAFRTRTVMEVPVGTEMAGRIVNALGEPIDGKGPIRITGRRPIERKAPNVVHRQPVNVPLHTGMKVIDALVPIGRGQRELIIGDRHTGKTTMAVDVILSQKEQNVFCIYVAIGQKASTIARVVDVLEKYGAMEYTTVVASLSDDLPAFRFLAPYSGCALGEEIMENGGDALVVYDDLAKHAVAYREICSLLRRPVGREAYPGDVFYIHSRLLERAAKLSQEKGGGSLTALPIMETQAGDVSAFIPTNVISICDGQIYLETGLFNEGFRPAMNVGLSVSRVGGAAQTKAIKKVAGRLRIDLAQYHEMASFVKFGAELDEATQAQLKRGERGRELLKQGQHTPLSVELEVVSLFAAVVRQTMDIPLSRIREYEEALQAFMKAERPGLLAEIAERKDLDDEMQETLARAIEEFSEQWLAAQQATEAAEADQDRAAVAAADLAAQGPGDAGAETGETAPEMEAT